MIGMLLLNAAALLYGGIYVWHSVRLRRRAAAWLTGVLMALLLVIFSASWMLST